MTAEKIILKYQEKGVKLFLNEDKLQFSGPKGIIDDDARKELQAYKDDIITYLKSHKGQVVCDKTQRFLPFEMTDIQVAYVIGRNRTYQYGGIGCKIYAEYEFPKLDLEKLERALALQCNDMEEYLSVKPEKLIQFLGEKYAKILIDTEKEVYDLVGYCMGGLIALETAKILTEAGKTVHSLISVDTTPSRRMVNNELLMERAFGMIIGADTYKVGHTVEDELLKRAIKELGEKYGDNVSNEELVSLEGEFLPVSQCYGKLIKKTHAERLLELYNTLPATKGETSGYSKERLDTLYKVFCHSFSAVIMYDAGIYVGNALVLSCRNKNSSFLPVEPTDNERFWKEATVGNITSELIEGEHLTCMTGSYADKVAERILKEERL